MAKSILPIAQLLPPHSGRLRQSMFVLKTKLDGVEWLAHPVEQPIHLVADNSLNGPSDILLDEPSQIVLLLRAPRCSQQLLPQGRDKLDDISVAGYKSDRIRPPAGGRHDCDGNGGVPDKAWRRLLLEQLVAGVGTQHGLCGQMVPLRIYQQHGFWES